MRMHVLVWAAAGVRGEAGNDQMKGVKLPKANARARGALSLCAAALKLFCRSVEQLALGRGGHNRHQLSRVR